MKSSILNRSQDQIKMRKRRASVHITQLKIAQDKLTRSMKNYELFNKVDSVIKTLGELMSVREENLHQEKFL